MKKKYIYFFISLVLGILSCNAIINLLNFNILVRMLFEGKEILHTILIFGATGITSFVFSKIFSKYTCKKNIENNEVLNDDDKEKRNKQKRKERKFLILSNTSIYILFSITNFFMNSIYLTDINLSYKFGTFYPIIVIITSILINLITLIPSNIVLYNAFNTKEDKKKSKIFKWIWNILYVIILIMLLCINIYYYVDIPEFKNMYEIYDDNVIINGSFQDLRSIANSKNLIIPEKIWGKKLGWIEYVELVLPDTKIYVPSTLSFENLRNISINLENEIEMYGEPITWFIKDNIAYDIDETAMVVLGKYNKDIIYVPESICNFFIASDKQANKEIKIAENNPYLYYEGNTIWSKCNRATMSGHVFYNTSYFNNGGHPTFKRKNITIPEHISGNIVIWQFVDTITIPKNLNNKIRFTGISNLTEGFMVEEGNELYSTYDGNLYNKEKTELVASVDNKYGILKLPNTLEKFENEHVISIVMPQIVNSKIAIDKISEEDGLVFENQTLYNKSKGILLASADKVCRIEKDIKEIDKAMLEYYKRNQNIGTLSFEVDDENQYFTVYEGNLYNKNKTELIHIDCKQDEMILPKEVEVIEDLILNLNLLSEKNIILEEGNNHFEIYENNLYTKDKKQLIALSNSSYDITTGKYKIMLPKEVEDIKEAVLEKIMFSEFKVEDGSKYVLYKGNLYNHDKTELIAFGKIENDKIIFAEEMKKINSSALNAFLREFHNGEYYLKNIINLELEKGNEYFEIKDNCLYTKNMKKLVMLSNYYFDYGRKIYLDENVITIDDSILDNFMNYENFEISENNKYIRDIVNNYIVYKKEYQIYMKK